MQHRRRGAFIGAALLTLAACGSGSDDAATAPVTDAPIATDAPADDPAQADQETTEAAATEEPDSDEATAATNTSPTEAPVEAADSNDAPESSDAAPPDDDTAPETVATEVPAPEAPAEPVVGGRLFAPDVQPDAQFDGNPFPDLVVDDIGKDAKVNLKNVLPSDRPVLLWAWAPH